MKRVTRGYRGEKGFQGKRKLYIGLQGVPGVTKGNIGYSVLRRLQGLQRVSRGYKRLERVTKGYKGLQGDTRGYKRFQRVTRGYKGLQRVTRGCRG